MAAATCARSIFRSASFRNAAAKLTAEAKSKAPRSPFRLSSKQTPRFLRSPVEMSCCVESLLPLHSATASAVLTSMLAVSRRGYGWLSEDINPQILRDLFRAPA